MKTRKRIRAHIPHKAPVGLYQEALHDSAKANQTRQD